MYDICTRKAKPCESGGNILGLWTWTFGTGLIIHQSFKDVLSLALALRWQGPAKFLTAV